jgi:hypothetical protein
MGFFRDALHKRTRSFPFGLKGTADILVIEKNATEYIVEMWIVTNEVEPFVQQLHGNMGVLPVSLIEPAQCLFAVFQSSIDICV